MGRLWAMAINTFREAVRDRVLHGVLAAGCCVLLFTLVLAELSLDQHDRVVRDLGLASISLFSVLVAIFLGSSLLYKEIERKTLYVILPKPISRAEFLLGKYVGICLTVYVFVVIMGALQLWIASLQAGASAPILGATMAALLAVLGLGLWRASDRTVVVLPWSVLCLASTGWLAAGAGVPVSGVFAQLVLVGTEVAVLSAVALLFSSFSTPFLTGVFTLGVWLMGRSADDMNTLTAKRVGKTVMYLLRGSAEVLPNLHVFVPGNTILFGEAAAPWAYVGTAGIYGVFYLSVTLAIAVAIFSRRDFL